MTFASHFFSDSRWVRDMVRAPMLLSIVLAAVLMAVIVRGGGGRLSVPDVAPEDPCWREATASATPDFSVLRGPCASGSDTDQAAFLSEFRFAGIFFCSEGNTETLRRGVLSYLPENHQEIVSEGTVVAGVRVKRIADDHIVLEKDGVEGLLTLGGAGNGMTRSYLDQAEPGEAAAGQRRTRFGEQTGDGVWTLQKQALQDYYEELLDEPERLLQVFDSMRPLYADDGESIEGYQLQAVGEQAFFEAVGIREGDVVRKVNALPMTNRGRAEFFIRQVVQDRVSAIVIDIEREGGPKRLVYELR